MPEEQIPAEIPQDNTAPVNTPAPEEDLSGEAILENVLADMDGDGDGEGEGDGAPAAVDPPTDEPTAKAESKPEESSEEPSKDPAAEPAVEDPSTEEPSDDPLERVKKAEMAILKQKEALDGERQKIESERQQFQQLNEAVQNMQSAVKEDPLGFIEKYSGLSFEDLARRRLRGGVPSAEEQARLGNQAAMTRLEKIEQENKELRERMESRERHQQEERYREEYRADIQKALQDEKRSFLAQWPNGAQLIEQTAAQAAKAGYLLPADQAADRVQQELVKNLQPLLSYQAVQQALGFKTNPFGESNGEPSNGKPAQSSQSQQPVTPVGNDLTPSHSGQPKDPAEMTEDERIAYAVQSLDVTGE